jgi:signal transduction histidine kinase
LFHLLPRKTTLRMRVVLCCAALGGVIGVCLAFVSERIADHFEHLLIREEMNAELDAQIAWHTYRPDSPIPRSAWKSLYIDRPGQPPTSPLALRLLTPEIHELEDPKNYRFTAIRITPIGRVTIVAALPYSPARERRFAAELLAMILLGIGLGAWLGRMLAGNMLAPVLRLSHEVDSAEQGVQLLQIASDHRADEVGALAHALIRYRARMQLAIEREVLFSADASHELRTPLGVLQGALDLQRESLGPAAPGRRRVERMRRSAAEMGTLLDALLLIARSDEAQDAPNAPAELGSSLASVIAEFREELDSTHITIKLRCAANVRVQAPPELLRVVLRLLFRSIASGIYGNCLRLDADVRGIVLASDKMDAIVAKAGNAGASGSIEAPSSSAEIGVQAEPAREQGSAGTDANPRRSDETGGVGMLRRLCQRYGWALELAQDATQPTLLGLHFWSPDESPPIGSAG